MFYVAGAVIAAGAAVYTADQNRKTANTAIDEQKRIANQQLAESDKLWNRYIQNFAPLEDQILKEVSKPVTEQQGTKLALATIDRGFGNAEANARRSLGGRYQYGSGIEIGSLTGLNANRVQAKAGAVANAANNALDKKLQVANIGRGLPAQSASLMNSASGTYGNIGNLYAGAAQGTWDSIGTGVGNLMQIYSMQSKPVQQPAVTTPAVNTYTPTNTGYAYPSNYEVSYA